MTILARNGRERQRLAWGILLTSFFVCAVFTVAVPIAVNAFVQRATRELQIAVQANQGTVGIDDGTEVRRAVLPGQDPQTALPGARILTDGTATGLISIFPPETEQLLARLQVYGNTIVEIEQAATPRFSYSDAEQVLTLALVSGRLRLDVPESGERPFLLYLTTPQGNITIREPGQYSLFATNQETQVSVNEGVAQVSANGEKVELTAAQRSVIAIDSVPSAPLETERDLILNGDFSTTLDKWSLFLWNIELPNEPKGRTEVVPVNGEPTLRFIRDGIGHADVKIRQLIGEDIADYRELQLQLTGRIVNQSLAVCGIQGSECPLFLRINYIDQNGVSRVWQHGFYAVGEVSNQTPDACISCSVVQGSHERVPQGQVFFYEIDFRDVLARQGVPPPRFIESLSLVASGHSFVVEVMDVALMVDE